ncbi:cobyrinate a,c-diamide synthase [Aquimarina rhabdastrellae]
MSTSFLIGAPWSNSGKTTVTLGLIRYLKNKGYTVQSFKCGPDYIDTIHHSTAAGNPSINLDSIMMSETHLKETFYTYQNKADICIVEGVMGLFDGAVKDKGSSAEIAKILDIPVILVVNAQSMAYSIAPILAGLKNFDPKVKIAGVLFNFVRTVSHYAFLKEACEQVGLKSLGYIPPNDDIAIPSRHLGLHIDASFEEVIEKAAAHISEHIAIEELLKLGKQVEEKAITKLKSTIINTYRIAIAKDEAFSFTYTQNLAYLKTLGEVLFFSPLHDEELPEADFIYLAGGYPELYLEQLSGNTKMKAAIKAHADNGGKILAECGGMMYLGNSITDENGVTFPMVSIFPYQTSMENKRLHLGYRRISMDTEQLWGHEFHYSSIQHNEAAHTDAKVYTARNKEIDTRFYTYKKVLASYIHLYWGAGNFKWLEKH